MKNATETTPAAALEDLFGGGPELGPTYWMDRYAKESAMKAELLTALKGMLREFGASNGPLDPEISADKPRLAAIEAIAKAERTTLT